jgi:hypothetical protein
MLGSASPNVDVYLASIAIRMPYSGSEMRVKIRSNETWGISGTNEVIPLEMDDVDLVIRLEWSKHVPKRNSR